MSYYIDLWKIDLISYKEKLKNADLLPSRMLLKEKIDEIFSEFLKLKINNIKELKSILSNKKNFNDLLKNHVFEETYLKILLREINSMLPTPNKLADIPGLKPETVNALVKIGLKDTFKLFDHIRTKDNRLKLQMETGLKNEEIIELTHLTDLSRIKWGSSIFVRMLYESGYDKAQKIAEADFAALYEKLKNLNIQKQYFKGNIGMHDIKLFVESASEVPDDIEW